MYTRFAEHALLAVSPELLFNNLRVLNRTLVSS